MKTTIIYDISIILMGELNNSNRTGVYFCAYSILDEMIKHPDIEVLVYSRPIVFCMAESFVKDHFGLECEQVINQGVINKTISRLWTRIEKNRLKKRKKNKVVYYLLCACKCLLEKLSILSEIKLDRKCKEGYVFFSPMEQAPKSLCRNIQIRKYIIVHDVIAYMRPEYFPGFNSMFNNHWLKAVVKRESKGEYYFANSNCTKRDFINVCRYANEENVDCVYHACRDLFIPKSEADINRVRDKYSIPAGKKYIFSLCSIEPRKNLPRILRSFFDFIEKNGIEDLVFVVGGTAWNSFEAAFSSEMEKLQKYADKLIRIGYVDDLDLPALYSGAYWFVYTSEYEGFGVPPLEALKCGCPVIVSDSSSIPEVVGDSGQYVKWNSDEEHIAAYEKYYYDDDLRTKMRKMGLKRSDEFSWSKTTEMILTKILSDEAIFDPSEV